MSLRYLTMLAVVACAVAVAWWWRPLVESPAPIEVARINAPTVNQQPVAATPPITVNPVPPSGARVEVGAAATDADHPTTSPLPTRSGFRDEDYGKSRMDIYGEYYRAAQDWNAEDYYRQRAVDGKQLTGEDAYQTYVYLRSCLDTPRDPEAMRQRLESLRQRHVATPQEMPADELTQLTTRYQDGLARCGGVHPGNEILEPILIDWLVLAADRGYPQAELAYYQSARWLMIRKPQLVYRQPDRIEAYRQRAPTYLKRALESGHSEAFTENAMALMEGIVVERDTHQAYAYAHAADLASHGQNESASRFLAILDTELSIAERADARERGRELCERFCR